MRMLMVGAALVMMTAAAMADDGDANAQKQAMRGRDDYWHCLAREYSCDSNQGLSGAGFHPLGRRGLSLGAAVLPRGAARLSDHAISRTSIRAPISLTANRAVESSAEGHRHGLREAPDPAKR